MATDAQAAKTKTSIIETPADQSLLEKIVTEGRLGQTQDEQTKSKAWITTLADEVLNGQIQVNKDTDRMLGERIAKLDEMISAQLNEVMHAPEFQKIEGAWRGLQYLTSNTDTSTMLKIKVLNVSKKDVLKDFTK